jgi:hypothetical protein
MAAAVLLAPAGCSFGGDDEPKPVSGVPKEIVATVDALGVAVAEKDFAEVCDELFTAAARKRAGGTQCAAQLRSSTEGLRGPTIEIRGIDLKGDRATVLVATTAEGQDRVIDALDMRRQRNHWRIEALGRG